MSRKVVSVLTSSRSFRASRGWAEEEEMQAMEPRAVWVDSTGSL